MHGRVLPATSYCDGCVGARASIEQRCWVAVTGGLVRHLCRDCFTVETGSPPPPPRTAADLEPEAATTGPHWVVVGPHLRAARDSHGAVRLQLGSHELVLTPDQWAAMCAALDD